MYTHETALRSLFNLREAISIHVGRVTDQQVEATNKGMALYDLGEFTQSQPYLTIGATAGDRVTIRIGRGFQASRTGPER